MLLLALACRPEHVDATPRPDDGWQDLTEDFPDPPEGGLAIRSPVMEIPPYSEVLLCYFGTYEGPTVGVDFMQPLQSDYSHHNQLKAVRDEVYADGELIDCAINDSMAEYAPIFEAVGLEATRESAEGNWLNLPDGIAMKLEGGQRWTLDMHYINPTGDWLLVNNGVNLGVMDLEEVDAWAGAMQFDAGPIEIDAGADHQEQFDCVFESDAHILSLMGHMHSRGTHYRIDHRADVGLDTVYDLEWIGGEHPYYPMITSYDPGEFPVAEGDSLQTTCDWTNTDDHDLVFPEEMCTTIVVMYPLEPPRTCIRGQYQD